MDQGLTIYKSSAGSGKTFTLVLEYLKIIILEPNQYRHVLAVTFTNKATEEMKNRIIAALGTLATGTEEELEEFPYYHNLQDYLDAQQLDKPLTVRKQARLALNYILNDYSNFAVSTIESFFQRIVRAFARELNIPLGYDVEMRQDLVLDQIISDTLLDVGKDPDLTKLFVNFVGRNLSEEKSWNVDKEVKNLGAEIFKENFQELIVQLNDGKLDVSIEGLMKMAQEVRGLRERFEKKMAEFASEALSLMEHAALTIEDFKYGRSGVAGYFLNVEKRQDYEPGKRAREAASEEEIWVSKTSNKREQILDLVRGGLQYYLQQMVNLYDRDFPMYNTAKQVSRTIYSFGVLNNLREKLNEYRREHAQLIISDTNFLLNDIVYHHADHAPFIYEKVGTQFYYYLLDEFQDTSEMQWKNIFPLLHEALAYGKKSLIVGDVKQSIYRWRNGDWRLLLSKVEEDLQRQRLVSKVKNLQNNWRTSREIVEFNNEFFEHAARILGEEFEQDAKFDMAYQEVKQEARKTRYPGLVELSFFSRPKRGEEGKGSWQEQSLDYLGHTLQQIQEDGFLLSDVTLLVRTNGEGVKLAEFLQEQDIQVVSAESLLLISDPKVRLIQAMLQYLNHEDDSIAMAGLAYYLHRLLSETEASHEWFSQIDQGLSGIIPPTQKLHLRQLPVYACVEEILNLIPHLKSESNAYLQGFLDAVLEYTSTQDASISGFLTWWEKEKYGRSIHAAPNPHAVQIMTIHKSKGLEFPIVILPFCEWSLIPEGRGVLWVQPQEKPYDSFSFFPVHPHSHLLDSAFKEEYREELIASKLDNLNILYVAFTRAQFRLYISALKPSQSKKKESATGISTLGKLMHESLNRMQYQAKVEENRLIFGQSFSVDELEEKEKTSQDRLTTQLRPNLSTLTDWSENIRIKYQINPEDFRSFDRDNAQLREGNLLHDALHLVIQHTDTERAANSMYLRGAVDLEGKGRLKARLDDVVNHLQATDWYSGNWDVKNEAEIITASGKMLRPDRVMIRGELAIVVDYKTGLPREYHHQQVARYKEILKQMGYKKVKGYLYYLSLNSVDEVGN